MRTNPRPGICTLSPEMLGIFAISNSSNLAWPAANDAIFVPLALSRPILAKRLYIANGSVASGNLDLGIYTFDGARIVSAGSTAQSGTTAIQFLDITDTYLSPGRYYLAAAMNGTTGAMRRFNYAVIRQQMLGVYKMATAFPLPATATFATPTASAIPLIGVDLGGIV